MTPDDDMVRINRPPGLFDKADEVHISCAWSYDLPQAERLAKQWAMVAPVKIGGPATGMRGEEFTPGMYVKNGYTITSRGCPNHCWFCSVPEREGAIREYKIYDGWNILDDNLLACSNEHIKAVFDMLSKQKQRPEFSGGLEAKRLKPWIADRLYQLRPEQMFFAYDTPDDLDPLRDAGRMLINAGFPQGSHDLRCYVLIGYKGDTLDNAESRLKEAASAGFFPMAMLYRDKTGKRSADWMKFQRQWARPTIINALLKAI